MVSVILLLLVFPYMAFGNSIHWFSYNKGLAEARRQNKPVYLHFSAKWCGYCRKMEKITFQKEKIISYLNDHFISIKVNTEDQQKIARKYHVTALPDNRFLNKNGGPAYRVPGFIDSLALGFFLEYILTKAYKTMDPMAYYQSKKAE